MQDAMEVRYMDWGTDLQRLHSHSEAALPTVKAPKQPEWLRDTPQIDDSATYDVILGSDVLYEVCLAQWNLEMATSSPQRAQSNLMSSMCRRLHSVGIAW